MPHAVLNGRDVSLPDAPSLADALRAIGVHLPALCHDERLEPTGACRLCLVRLNGAARPVPACVTPVTEGMTIDTSPPELEAARRGTLQMLAAGYPAEAARADPDKPFHQEIAIHGLDRELGGQANPAHVDRSHPFITVDMSRCIQCGRCVRICDELQGQFVWHLRDRGADVHIEPDGPDLLNSSCVSCGACVDTCPTGALEDATFDTLGAPSSWTRTVCPYCGTGCELAVGTRDGAIVSVKPQRHSPVSKGHLCVKGRYAFEFVSAGDRIVEPMIREDREWRRVSWDEALSYAADGLRRARDQRRARRRRSARVGKADQRRELPDPEVRQDRRRHEQRRLLRARLPYAELDGPEGDARLGPVHQLVRRHRTRRRHSRVWRQRDRKPPHRRRAHQAGRQTARCGTDRRRSAAHRAGGVRRVPSRCPSWREYPAAQRDGACHRRRAPRRPHVHRQPREPATTPSPSSSRIGRPSGWPTSAA